MNDSLNDLATTDLLGGNTNPMSLYDIPLLNFND